MHASWSKLSKELKNSIEISVGQAVLSYGSKLKNRLAYLNLKSF